MDIINNSCNFKLVIIHETGVYNKNENVDNDKETDFIKEVSLYKYLKELAIFKYEHEVKREDSLISQANSMQSVFSFLTVTILMVVTIIFDKISDKLILNLTFGATSWIMFFMILSLIFACASQFRFKKYTMEDIKILIEFNEQNIELMQQEYHQLKQFIDSLSDIQERLGETNGYRVILIHLSMLSFFISIILVVCFYFHILLTI